MNLINHAGCRLTRGPSFWLSVPSLLLLVGLSLQGNAQTPRPDALNPSADSQVITIVPYSDGRILVGGTFKTLGGQARNGIGRLHADGSLDLGFNPGADQTASAQNRPEVMAFALQPDGKIIVGGWFNRLGGKSAVGLGRLYPDGALDASFSANIGNSWSHKVRSLILQPDGRILVGGVFSQIGAVSLKNLGRLNPDGSVDTSFNPSADGEVYSLALQPDGRIMVGGAFNRVAGTFRKYLARLNADGSLDQSFTADVDNAVTCVAVQADGAIVIGGRFWSVGGLYRGGLARVKHNGELDPSFSASLSSSLGSTPVSSVLVQADQRLLVAGAFSVAAAQARGSLARFNADGSLDKSFNAGASSSVSSVAAHPDGRLLVGGQFTNLASVPRAYLGRLVCTEPPIERLVCEGGHVTWLRNGASPEVLGVSFEASLDGTNWTPLGSGERVPGGWRGPAEQMPATATIRARGWVVGGSGNGSTYYLESFTGALAISAHPGALTNNAGTEATFVVTAGPGPASYQWLKDGVPLRDSENIIGATTPALTLRNVSIYDRGGYSVEVSDDSRVLHSRAAVLAVRDPFIVKQPANRDANVGESATLGVVAGGTTPFSWQWYKDGAEIPGARAASLSFTNIQWADGGKYYVQVRNSSGSETSSVASVRVKRLFPDAFSPNANHYVYAFALQTDGKILMGGSFTKLGAETRLRIGRVHPDGTLDPAFNPAALGGQLSAVRALAVQPDGHILVAGTFTNLAGVACTNLGRLHPDGSFERALHAPSGFSGSADCLILQPDGCVIVGGAFTTLCGQPRTGLGRLKPDGSLDEEFNPVAAGGSPAPAVTTLALQPDGKIIVGGTFTFVNGVARNRFSRLNPDGTLDETFSPATYGSPMCLVAQRDGKIVVGGAFSTIDNQPRRNLGRLYPDGTLDLDFNPGADASVMSMTMQSNGKIVLSGEFDSLGGKTCYGLGRLLMDGSVDGEFDESAIGFISANAFQPNGSILVGGDFRAGSYTFRYEARITNNDKALDHLGYDGTNICWLRSGGAPEFYNTRFDFTIDGHAWVYLGPGLATPDGWLLPGVSLPGSATIRARGFVSGGYHNGCSWFEESFSGNPIISGQPMSRTNNAGTVVKLEVLAGGSEPLGYQWYKDGKPLSDVAGTRGSESPTLVLDSVLGGDAGSYRLMVSNHLGAVTSHVANLAVIDPCIVEQPTNVVSYPGWSVTFRVAAAASDPVSYQWRRNGVPLPDASSSTLVLNSVGSMERGVYDVVISNRFGQLTSAAATLALRATADSFDPRPDGAVYAIAEMPDRKILVGGAFSTLAGQPCNGLGRLYPDGLLDPTFRANADASVYSVLLQADSSIVVAGSFTRIGGHARQRLARLQSDGSVDETFDLPANARVCSLALERDGAILLAGDFTMLGGQPRRRLARIKAGGSLDETFAPAADQTVYCLAVQSDGKILVGGSFDYISGQPCTNLARLHPDGTLDRSFLASADGEVYALSIQRDGQIIVGGDFNYLAGQPRSNLGRLLPDGTLDAQFKPAPEGDVRTIALQEDGRILVGGLFWYLSGKKQEFLGRLLPDGSVDQTFSPVVDANVNCLCIQADGNILAGGFFTMISGNYRKGLGRIYSPQAADQSLVLENASLRWFRTGSHAQVSWAIFEASTNSMDWARLGEGEPFPGGWQLSNVPIRPDATTWIRARGLVVGGMHNSSGWFTESLLGPPLVAAQSRTSTNAAGTTILLSVVPQGSGPFQYQWWKDGVQLTDGGNVRGSQSEKVGISGLLKSDEGVYSVVIANAFGTVSNPIANVLVMDPYLHQKPYSQLFHVGQSAGMYCSASGTDVVYRWRKDGADVPDSNTNYLKFAAIQTIDAGDYRVVVSNAFGCLTSSVATLTVNAAIPDGFNPGLGPLPWARAFALAEQTDGQILLGGNFETVAGYPRSYLARVLPDGTVDESFDPSPDAEVHSIAIQSDRRMLVGGLFTTLANQACTNLGRLLPDGRLDPTFNAGMTNQPLAGVELLALQPDGRILVAGFLRLLGGAPCSHLGRLYPDGTRDLTFNPAFNSNVFCLALQPDGKILVGGRFTEVSGQERRYLARLHPDGTLDAEFNPAPDNSVHSLAIQADGKVLVGGHFNKLAGRDRKSLGRLEADGTLDSSFAPTLPSSAYGLAVQSDGKILVDAAGLHRLLVDGSPDPFFDPNSSSCVFALQHDGRILVSAVFDSIAGQQRSNLARLASPDSASDSLSLETDGITWFRAGAAPEIWTTAFDYSTDGADWRHLGFGSRIPGGWRLPGVTVPAGSLVRAQGYILGGGTYARNSSWIVETTARALSGQPPIILSDDSFGFHPEGFGFNFTGSSNAIVIVERSTNLLEWSALETNLINTPVSSFLDRTATNTTRRFYRLRLP